MPEAICCCGRHGNDVSVQPPIIATSARDQNIAIRAVTGKLKELPIPTHTHWIELDTCSFLIPGSTWEDVGQRLEEPSRADKVIFNLELTYPFVGDSIVCVKKEI